MFGKRGMATWMGGEKWRTVLRKAVPESQREKMVSWKAWMMVFFFCSMAMVVARVLEEPRQSVM